MSNIFCEIALIWMPQEIADGESQDNVYGQREYSDHSTLV